MNQMMHVLYGIGDSVIFWWSASIGTVDQSINQATNRRRKFSV